MLLWNLNLEKFNFPLSFNTRSKSRERTDSNRSIMEETAERLWERVKRPQTKEKVWRLNYSLIHRPNFMRASFACHFWGRGRISPGNYPANTLTTPRATHYPHVSAFPSGARVMVVSGQNPWSFLSFSIAAISRKICAMLKRLGKDSAFTSWWAQLQMPRLENELTVSCTASIFEDLWNTKSQIWTESKTVVSLPSWLFRRFLVEMFVCTRTASTHLFISFDFGKKPRIDYERRQGD